MLAEIIYDNYSRNNRLVHGWCFSCLIDRHILFDTGEKGTSQSNHLAAMGADIQDIDTVVISHNHWDLPEDRPHSL